MVMIIKVFLLTAFIGLFIVAIAQLLIGLGYTNLRYKVDIRMIHKRYGWVSEKNRLRIYKKFERHLYHLLASERVYIKFYKSTDDLNAERLSKNPDAPRAAGIYSYYSKENDSPIKRFVNEMPKIHLVENTNPYDNLMVFAHELGHHFSIQYRDDNSEESADRMIIEFAKQCLTDWEFVCVAAILEIYANAKTGIDHEAILDKRKNEIETYMFKRCKRRMINKQLLGIPYKLKKLIRYATNMLKPLTLKF